ncbi:hypothetical protein NFI96_022644, partial [Prochilodus magdalenae]
ELSREFSSLYQEISTPPSSSAQSTSSKPQATTSYSSGSTSGGGSSSGSSVGGSMSSSSGTMSSRSTMSLPQTSTTMMRSSEPSIRSVDSNFTTGRNLPYSPTTQTPQAHSYTPPQSRRALGQLSPPNLSPLTQRRASPVPMRSDERNMSGSFSYSELSTLPNQKYDIQSAPGKLQLPANPGAPYDSATTGRRSPRIDRAPSPSPLSQPLANTLPRNFMPFKTSDEGMQRQRSPSKWNETDLDVSYERKPHHTYDKNEWIRPSVPNSNWRESNLDSPSTPRKDNLPRHLQPTYGTLPKTTRISVPPDRVSPTQSSYGPQPIISRISIPPSSSQHRQHRPIPLSVIMRLQNPYYAASTRYPHTLLEGEMDLGLHRQPLPPLPREYFYQVQPQPPEQRQPAYYGEVLNQADVDAEVERLNTVKPLAVLDGPVPSAEQSKEPKVEGSTGEPDPPRPLSPTRLQPVVAPEVPVVPNLEEILRIRAEIPRALKKRGSVDQSQTLKKQPTIQPNQYKQMINKLLRRKGPQPKGETGSESSSSEGEESSLPPTPSPPPLMNTSLAQQKAMGQNTILSTEVSSSGAEVSDSDAEVSSSDDEVSSSDAEVSSSDDEVSDSDAEVSSSDDEVSDSDAEVSSSDDEVSSSDAEVSSSDAEVSSSDAEVSDSDAEVSSSDTEGLHSILRKSSKGIGVKNPRARLSPLVLLLDGSLVGELDTVQRAVQEMSDPSQPNDEGITALHNAICGGHYAVVEFLVRIGANVSAPDSHGWTPLHCAASCNDRALCEFLVRNGAAVMAVTESDGATAAQKCDPYAAGYEECESFLRGVEEVMGVDNSGVLYALWNYPAQAPDELSFKEGDMVTILQKPEGVDWWWASLCGREGFVPNNYFGLFPKVRPRTLC